MFTPSVKYGYLSTGFKPVEPDVPKPTIPINTNDLGDSDDVEILADSIEPKRLFTKSEIKDVQEILISEPSQSPDLDESSVNSGIIPTKFGGRKKPISSAFMLKKTKKGRVEDPESLRTQVLNSDDMLLNPLGMCNTILSKKMNKKRRNLYKNQIGALSFLL